jgi:Mannitol repressor
MAQTPKPKTLRDLVRLSPTEAEIDFLLTELDTHNHRAAAILGGAFVEDALEYAIQRRLVRLGKERLAFLFEYPGPLSSFSAKIQVGFAIGLYGPVVRHDLDVIRQIRNGFPHAKKPISFDTPEVIKEIERSQYLKWKANNGKSDVFRFIPDTTVVANSQHRYQYVVLAKLLANELFMLGKKPRIRIRISRVSALP